MCQAMSRNCVYKELLGPQWQYLFHKYRKKQLNRKCTLNSNVLVNKSDFSILNK
jgi:hypothetical protein